MGFTDCDGLFHTLYPNSISVEDSTDHHPSGTASPSNAGGYTVSTGEGGHHSGGTPSTAFHLYPLLGGKGSGHRGISPHHQSKGPEQVSSEGDIQNGRTSHSSLPAPKRRLHDEARPAGCVLRSPDTSGLPEISSFSLRGNDIRVQLPAVRPLVGPPRIHPDLASSGGPLVLQGSARSHLPRRPTADAPSARHTPGNFPGCTTPAIQPRISGEAGEVLTGPHASPRVPWGSDRHNPDVHRPPRGADNNTGSAIEPPGPHEPRSPHGGVDRTPALQSPATPAGLPVPPSQMETEFSLAANVISTGGLNVVAVSDATLAQQAGHFTSHIRPHSPNRFLPSGMGRHLQWQDNGGALECCRSIAPHQLPRVEGSNFGLTVLPEAAQPTPETHPLGNGQHCRGRIREPPRGDTLLLTVTASPGPLVVPAHDGVMDDSPSPARSSERRGGCCVAGVQCPHRVDAPDGRFPRHHTTIRCPTDRPLRIAPESSDASLCITPPGPGSLRSGCLPPELEPVVLLHTPTSGAASPHSTETTGRRGYSAADSPQLARTSLVCTYPVDADGCTLSASPGGEPIVAAVRPDSCPPTLAVPATDCMAVIGQTFRSAGYPSSVRDVLLASWSASTKKRYTGPWRAWCQWCASRDLCPVSAPVPDVLTFLAEMTTGKRLEYRTLAVYSSDISQGHLPVDGSRLGRLPVVVRFMKGLFRLRPPTPRLSSTWDVQRLLTFLATLEPLADLTLKLLSLKLAALLALTSSARAHELVLLDTAWASIKSDSWEFTLGEHTKVSRPGHPPRRIYLPAFPDNPAICVVRTLLDYQARTATFRKSSRLLISFAKPYGAISSRTLSCWLRDCLRLANIEGPFTGHSTRSASTSATARMGLPLKLILEAADWSSAKTFHQFYQRPTNRGDLARAVLTALP